MLTRQRKPQYVPESTHDRILWKGAMLAPLCSVSDSAYRRICREEGAGLIFTEMISAEGITHAAVGSWPMLAYHPDESPIVVQLSSADPQAMAEAALLVQDLGFASVNLNMGCPARKVVKGDKGAGLMKDPVLAAEVVRQVVQAVDFPVTVKMRSGWDETRVNFLELGLRVQDAGAAAVILHPRTKTQGYSGFANWDHIRDLKQALEIPVIGNGDILDGPTALRMVRETGCDGVMIGRASFGNPWIFKEAAAAIEGTPIPPRPTGEEICSVIERHAGYMSWNRPDRFVCRRMRGHILWYTKGWPRSTQFRKYMVRLETVRAQLEACREYFLEGRRSWGEDD